ncbi:MAG: HCNGP-like protein-domain-containing protein, partial [Olpidium bornovanus]
WKNRHVAEVSSLQLNAPGKLLGRNTRRPPPSPPPSDAVPPRPPPAPDAAAAASEMPPKQPTPYQFSKNLTYSQDVPAFLRALKGMVPEEPTVETKRRALERPESGGDTYSGEEPEDERPVVVQVNSKHLSVKEAERLRKSRDHRHSSRPTLSFRPAGAASDEEGTKPMFRKPAETLDRKRKFRNNSVGANDAARSSRTSKKLRGKNKIVPAVHLGHLEEPDADLRNADMPAPPAKGGSSASGWAADNGKPPKSPLKRLPQYDGGGDDDSEGEASNAKVRQLSNFVHQGSHVLTSLVSYYGDSDEEEQVANDAALTETELLAILHEKVVLPGLAQYSDEVESGGEDNDKPPSEVIVHVSSNRMPKLVPAEPSFSGKRKFRPPCMVRVSSKSPSSGPNVASDAPASRMTASPETRTLSERMLDTRLAHGEVITARGDSPASGTPVTSVRERVGSFWEERRELLKIPPPDGEAPWALPPEPEGEPSAEVQARIQKYHALRQQGLNYNENLLKNKMYRNPRIYSKLVEFVDLDEIATNFQPEVYNPKGFCANSYYDQLAIVQRKRAEELAASQSANRSSVAFTSSSKTAVEPPPSIAASIAAAKAKAAEAAAAAIAAANRAKRPSKWDQQAPDRKRGRVP